MLNNNNIYLLPYLRPDRQLMSKGTSAELCERLLRYDLGKLDLPDLQCYSSEQNLPQASSNSKEQHIEQICNLIMTKDREEKEKEKENKKTITGKRKESEEKDGNNNNNTPSKKEKKISKKKQKVDAQPQISAFGELLALYTQKDLMVAEIRKLCSDVAVISKDIANREVIVNALDSQITALRGKLAGV